MMLEDMEKRIADLEKRLKAAEEAVQRESEVTWQKYGRMLQRENETRRHARTAMVCVAVLAAVQIAVTALLLAVVAGAG